MTPRDELRAQRRLGPEGARLLYRTVRSVAIAHRFPPPDGAPSWDESAVHEVAHDFVKDERGHRRLLDIALRSVDDVSFGRLLDAAVHNYLRDLGRGTDMGKLVRRVKEILHEEPEFEAVPGPGNEWALAGAAQTSARVDPAALSSAIAAVDVVVPRWTSSRRDAPLADRPSFVKLIRSVLTAAGGGLPAADIAKALSTRLDHRRVPLTTALDVLERISEPADGDAGPAEHAVAGRHAMEIFNALSDRERILVTRPDAGVRELAALIGTGKSQTAQIRQRLADRLRAELADDEEQHAARVLCDLCNDWVEQRTGQPGCDVS